MQKIFPSNGKTQFRNVLIVSNTTENAELFPSNGKRKTLSVFYCNQGMKIGRFAAKWIFRCSVYSGAIFVIFSAKRKTQSIQKI
jgi:hypothetical protein